MFLRTCVYRNDNSREKDTFDGLGINNKVPAEEPCPRFAHQLVYDHIKKVMHTCLGRTNSAHKITRRLMAKQSGRDASYGVVQFDSIM